MLSVAGLVLVGALLVYAGFMNTRQKAAMLA
jgi:hypothetical protein